MFAKQQAYKIDRLVKSAPQGQCWLQAEDFAGAPLENHPTWASVNDLQSSIQRTRHLLGGGNWIFQMVPSYSVALMQALCLNSATLN